MKTLLNLIRIGNDILKNTIEQELVTLNESLDNSRLSNMENKYVMEILNIMKQTIIQEFSMVDNEEKRKVIKVLRNNRDVEQILVELVK
jgi:hypothetical protein